MSFITKTPEELVTHFGASGSASGSGKLIEHLMFDGALNNPAIGFNLDKYEIKKSEIYIDKQPTIVWWITGNDSVMTFCKNNDTGLYSGKFVSTEVIGYDMMRTTIVCNTDNKTKLINSLGHLMILRTKCDSFQVSLLINVPGMIDEIRVTSIDDEHQFIVLHLDCVELPIIVSVFNKSADFIYDVFCVHLNDNILEIIDISNYLLEMIGGSSRDYIDLVFQAIRR